ncbi:hypothetical protein EDC94DRAFT_621824 [Helicostylum pulchrum]|uniref:Uncharacterized protein n=1 Tax=Helicostylum pulchrum TaxID=562976 RepID=A0ABP9Y5T3_9FUNG|nr:hypothetical protein EDC94DRAFT_621824 [Helicostylum pulchrum]
MESKAGQGGCLDYVYNCFKSLKNSFKDYQAYAAGYDAHQYQRHAMDSKYSFYWYPDVVTHSMDRLLYAYVPPSKRVKTIATNIADNVTHTFAYGAFALANLIWTEKKNIEHFFEQNICTKKSFDSEQFNDALENDILSRSTFISEDGQQYRPLKRPFDDNWGFIDYDDLSVQFKDTIKDSPPKPKPPRRLMKLRK